MNLIISFYYITNIKFAESYKLIIYMECKFLNCGTETKYRISIVYNTSVISLYNAA